MIYNFKLFARCKRSPALRLPLNHSSKHFQASHAVCTWVDVAIQSPYERTSLLGLILAENIFLRSSIQHHLAKGLLQTSSAIVISTHGHLSLRSMVALVTRYVQEKEGSRLSHDSICSNITFFECATLQQFTSALEGLWAYLDVRPQVRLVLIEDLDAFYWQLCGILGPTGCQQRIAYWTKRVAAIQEDFGCAVACGRSPEATRNYRHQYRSHTITEAQSQNQLSANSTKASSMSMCQDTTLYSVLVKSKVTGQTQVLEAPAWIRTPLEKAIPSAPIMDQIGHRSREKK